MVGRDDRRTACSEWRRDDVGDMAGSAVTKETDGSRFSAAVLNIAVEDPHPILQRRGPKRTFGVLSTSAVFLLPDGSGYYW